MVDDRRRFGDGAEDLAARFLESKGYKILARQYRNQFGEIDLIASWGAEIVFVEVKARHDATYGFPEEAVTGSKLKKIEHGGEQWLREQHLEDRPYRIDVVAIEYQFDPPRLTHIESAC
jgi:putative endonuclease